MISRDFTDKERLDWLRLVRSENVGPVAFKRLLQRYGTAESALAALPDLSRCGGAKRPITIASAASAEKEIHATEALGGRIIAMHEPDYPVLLRTIPDAPPIITVFGRYDLLHQTNIAIVGARNASTNGHRIAHSIAHDLAQQGIVVTSGLARGIDTSAHTGAQPSNTIAVVAGGIDIIYPRENTELYESIRDSGCIISEMPLGTTPQARHFPRRNRIVSGLSLGTVVIEATIRSGSLITAKFAADQGREVMAVPGFPSDSRSAGPNSLIKDGATLIENAEDILNSIQHIPEQPCLPGFSEEAPPPPPSCLSRSQNRGLTDTQRRNKVLETLTTAPLPVDVMLRECQLSAAEGAVILLELELAGRIERCPGHMIALLANG